MSVVDGKLYYNYWIKCNQTISLINWLLQTDLITSLLLLFFSFRYNDYELLISNEWLTFSLKEIMLKRKQRKSCYSKKKKTCFYSCLTLNCFVGWGGWHVSGEWSKLGLREYFVTRSPSLLRTHSTSRFCKSISFYSGPSRWIHRISLELTGGFCTLQSV